MNEAHLHLLVNHFPIIGVVIGILILATGFIYKTHPAIKRIALGLFIVVSLFAGAAYLTGEGAEEIVENIPEASELLIEEHEDAGKLFLILAGILGLISIVTLYLDVRTQKSKLLYIVVLLVAIAACISGVQTGTTGGKVRHTEIRDAGQSVVQPENEKSNLEEEDD